MQFPDCHGRQRQRWRPPRAALFLLGLTTLAGAQPLVFDEKLKAPMMRDVGELRTQAQAIAVQYREQYAAAPEQIVRNFALARQLFDLRWQVQRSIDQHRPLDELAELGLVSRGDGSYSINLSEHPQWNDLHETMAGIISRADFEETGPGLIRAGFRPADVTALKEYVSTHDPDVAAAAEALPIVLGFSRAVRKYDKLRRPVPEGLAVSFIYQRARAISESNRRWVEGLFELLDAQRVRIVMSAFTEIEPTVVWIPEDISQGIAEYLVKVRQPDFEARATAEAKGVAQ